MILIITHKTDFTADFVINKLNTEKIPYKRFNCEDIFSYNVSLNYNSKFSYSILGENHYDAVWFRRTMLPEIDSLPNNEKLYILNETDAFIKNLFTVISAKWVSDPFYVYRAENKFLQLKIAQDIGFTIPSTLITQSKTELNHFFQEHNRSIIIKPIFQTRIPDNDSQEFLFTSLISQEHIDKIDDYDLTPCIYQENVEKDYEIRVTVVGKSVFAAATDSQQFTETKIDWRKRSLIFTKIDLPKQVESLCLLIIAKLNLKFGAIDIIKTKDDKYIFLEVNPNGQWVWIETQTGLKISEALINELNNK